MGATSPAVVAADYLVVRVETPLDVVSTKFHAGSEYTHRNS